MNASKKYQAWGIVGSSYSECICEVSANNKKDAKAKFANAEPKIKLTSAIKLTPKF